MKAHWDFLAFSKVLVTVFSYLFHLSWLGMISILQIRYSCSNNTLDFKALSAAKICPLNLLAYRNVPEQLNENHSPSTKVNYLIPFLPNSPRYSPEDQELFKLCSSLSDNSANMSLLLLDII